MVTILPFTFDIINFTTAHYLRLNPDHCGEKFSIGFSSNDDFKDEGDVMLNVTFIKTRERRQNFLEYATIWQKQTLQIAKWDRNSSNRNGTIWIKHWIADEKD
uniref:Uncharacterized protein n=1 Tax=Romanomermis culicivorax TaxID=13658 RepID=A0A915K919_ROMCU